MVNTRGLQVYEPGGRGEGSIASATLTTAAASAAIALAVATCAKIAPVSSLLSTRSAKRPSVAGNRPKSKGASRGDDDPPF